MIEQILEEISYDGPDGDQKEFVITKDYVNKRMEDYVKSTDYSKYML